jgi:hypothetical protein
MKRITSWLVCITLFLCMMPTVSVKAATKFENIKITEISNMDDFDAKVEKSWEMNFNFKGSDHSTEYRLGKFTLKKDSVVRFVTSSEGSLPKNREYHVYGNESMGAEIGEGYFEGYDNELYLTLKAGTYYVKTRADLGDDEDAETNCTLKLSIGAVPTSNSVKVKQKVNGKKTSVTVTISDTFTYGIPEYAQWGEGKKNPESSFWEYFSYDEKKGSFTVKKNGWYTVRLMSDAPWEHGVWQYVRFKVTGIDDKKPTVTGVKNNKTYKNAVTIKFSDNKNGSGIKSATLNGKKIKSGKKVSKKGKYTLKVTDKAGNKKTIKFTIK